jgi:PKD repeat protein
MRKLYALFTGILITLLGTTSNALPVTPDVANFNFSVNNNTRTVVFVNTSTIGDEPGHRFARWIFGDGSSVVTGPLQGTFHQYPQPGTYNACLKIYRVRTSTPDTVLTAVICKTIIIQRICTADFIKLPPTTANPLLVTYKAIPWSNNGSRPERICWRFGDGTDTCINYSNSYTGLYTVNHRYNVPGNYEVCVKIIYPGGCEANKCKMITITRPDECTADFERVPSTYNNPLRAYFKALPNHNNNRKPARICWNFGDGSDTCINYAETYNGLYAVGHTYTHPGNFEVCVKIIYYGGCEARKCHVVAIPGRDTCTADFERINTTSNPLRALFKALPNHNNNRKPARICWNFGDGSDTCINYPESYTGLYTVAHNYVHPGNFEVCVKIIYYGGCEARKCHLVRIAVPDSCSIDFERVATPASAPLQVAFKALPQHNNNRKPARICWRFGDGTDTCINYAENYSGLYTVLHRYNHPGNYEVCVNVLYYGGCEARKCHVITVPPPPVACSVRLFEIVPAANSLTRGFIIIPSAPAPAKPVRICWYFGDGEDTCIIVDPAHPMPYYFMRHTYPAPGLYRACVKVLFDNGCRTEECREVFIHSAVAICGGYMYDSVITPRTIKFKGFSIHARNDEALSYRWTFGDGTTAFGREVTHTYAHGGNYEVCLYIRTRLGCETRICKTITINATHLPQLHLSPNPVLNTLNVDFYSTHNEMVNIRIINSNGTQVRSYSRVVVAGPNNWTHDLSTLLPGLYTYTVQSPNQLASSFFLKL